MSDLSSDVCSSDLQAIYCTGAIERPLVFADNDRPGVMTASAVQAYVNRYAVRPGRRAVVFHNNAGGSGAALDMKASTEEGRVGESVFGPCTSGGRRTINK